MRSGIAVALVVCLAACSSDTAAPAATTPSSGTDGSDTTHVHDTTAATDAPETSTVLTTTPTTELNDTPAVVTAADLTGPCAMTPVPPEGQVTFVSGGKLWASDSAGVHCLADLQGRNPSWISWSPDGDEVLVGPDTLLRADGSFTATGYFPTNRALRWSWPTGKALVAPNATTGHLIWRNAHDSGDRIDISFMERTDVASYHPAGKHVVAAGVGNDGLGEGVFVASNRGANAQRIGTAFDGEITDLRFDSGGDAIVFIHHHPDGMSEVHRYTFSSGFLETLASVPDEVADHLVISDSESGDAAWALSHSTQSSHLQLLLSGTLSDTGVPMPAETWLEPLGWTPGHHLLVAGHSPGLGADAPYGVWQWSPTGGTVHVVDDVSAAATRSLRGPYVELNIIPGSGFG